MFLCLEQKNILIYFLYKKMEVIFILKCLLRVDKVKKTCHQSKRIKL